MTTPDHRRCSETTGYEYRFPIATDGVATGKLLSEEPQ